jgi:hypothetical protein
VRAWIGEVSGDLEACMVLASSVSAARLLLSSLQPIAQALAC